MTEGEMVGWHHRLDGHEYEQAPGDGEVCSPWRCKESDTKELATKHHHLLLTACRA